MKALFRIFVLLLMIDFLFSCTKSSESEDRYTLSFSKNSSLQVEPKGSSPLYYGSILEGDNLVFEYRYDRADSDLISDDEYTEVIRFEVNKDLNEVALNGILDSVKIVYTPLCFCGFSKDKYKPVSPRGTFAAKKISDEQWQVSLNAEFYGSQNRSFSGLFSLVE